MKIKTLQIFTDYVCPWCYLGQARLKKVIAKYKIKLDIIHFPLHPDTPKEGRNLLDLFGCSKEELNRKNSMINTIIMIIIKSCVFSNNMNSNMDIPGAAATSCNMKHTRVYEKQFA